MKTELALDTGDILLVKRCEVGNLTCDELTERLAVLGAEAAFEAVELLEQGKTQLLMQDDSQATFCKKVKKEDGKIDFSDSPQHICRLIKAFSPAPAAFCNYNGTVLNVYNAELCALSGGKAGEVLSADKRGIAVSCNGGSVLITELQPAGGKRMKAADFVNGRKIKAGDLLD